MQPTEEDKSMYTNNVNHYRVLSENLRDLAARDNKKANDLAFWIVGGTLGLCAIALLIYFAK